MRNRPGLLGNPDRLLQHARIVFVITACLSLTVPVFSGEPHRPVISNGKLKVNPEYKIRRYSNGTVVVTARHSGGNASSHVFEGLHADVLLAVYRNQPLSQLIPVLARKYYYDNDECRREIKHAINTLTEWKILLQT